jgi:hypothetical protein
MVRVIIDKDMIHRAISKHLNTPLYAGHAIADGKGRFWGFLGEEVVAKASNPLGWAYIGTKDFDFTTPNGKSVEVKTKIRVSKPAPFFDGSVESHARHQKNDFYLHVQVVGPKNAHRLSLEELIQYPYKEAYICGICTREEFFSKSTLYLKGQKDPSNGIIYDRCDTNVLSYNKMRNPIILFKESNIV